jgi:hypothetical protein
VAGCDTRLRETRITAVEWELSLYFN